VPQGTNPLELLLDKPVAPPGDLRAGGTTKVSVRFEEVNEFEYQTVRVLPDGLPSTCQDVY